jgi:DNA-directed RNA polymerase specialized sigma24 family protein
VLRDDLAAAAEAVRRAEADLETRKRELRALVLAAREEGLPIATIARATGRVRETIYRDLERAERER